MSLKIYKIEQCEEWDAIVRSFHSYDVYWLSGYVKAFQIHRDGEPLLFFYEDESIRGINVVMMRDISRNPHFVGIIEENKFFDFASPYGYGGWLIEGTKTEILFTAYENWCINHGIISEFVRYHPVIGNQLACEDSYNVVPLGNTVAMDLSSPAIIWNNIISKNRNMIRKAKKNGIVIYSGRYPEIYKTFREIYNSTMDKDNAEDYYYFEEKFYESILNDLPQNAQVFYAVYQNKVVAASIMLSANGYMNYHLSGSIREYANMAPTNLLLYEAALWGCANGCRSLHLGGGVGSEADNLYKFKKAFYRLDDVKRFFIGRKIFIPDTYEKLVNMRVAIENPNYFPKYRG